MSEWSRKGVGAAVALVGMLASVSCGEAVREGRASSYLVIDTLTAASGANPQTFSSVLASDVQTLVNQTVNGQQVKVPTVFEDGGQVEMHMVMKNVGIPGVPTLPTSNNEITVYRYRVAYKRADGRNTPGVDVPYPFDGAVTLHVGSQIAGTGFILVRLQAKLEPPLRALVGSGGAIVISALAEVTFWGKDGAGNDVSVTGEIGVNFSDWGDPSS